MKEQKIVRFQLDAKSAKALQAEAERIGLSTSAFIRLLIRNWSDGIRFEKEKEGSK